MTNYFLILPLLPILAWALGGATIGAGIGYAAKKKLFDEEAIGDIEEAIGDIEEAINKSKKIAVLGLQGAGKTTFLKFLQGNKDYKKYVSSGVDNYEDFNLEIKDRIIKITKNIDIGGGRHFVRNYNTILEDADSVFFLFDVSLFFNDNEYYRDFCSRVDYLKNLTKIKTCFIATHPDKLPPMDNLKVKISEKLIGKNYKSYVEEKLFVINLTVEKEISEFVNKVFV